MKINKMCVLVFVLILTSCSGSGGGTTSGGQGENISSSSDSGGSGGGVEGSGGGGGGAPVCENHICEAGETTQNCATDCPASGPVCGNHICEAGETTQSCATDCPASGPVCGNGTCETASETFASCPADCHCGNGACDAGETFASCAADCHCGNGACDAGETNATCPADCPAPVSGAIIADHIVVGVFDSGIPADAISRAKSDLNIFYGHTSHGSQLLTGLDMITSPVRTGLTLSDTWADLGHSGDTSWVDATNTYLASHSSVNVVMWSWCGGVSDNTPAGIDAYLNAMNGLEAAHPGVRFVYMTGRHYSPDDGVDAAAVRANIKANNDRIRNYCRTNNKILYDFADVEEYAPNGANYPDMTDYCEWCGDEPWVGMAPACGDCAHSQCFNCYLKGKAFWWLLARIGRWGG